MSPTFASLRYPNYRLWFVGALVANTGTWMQRVAQDWLVLTQLTHDSGVAVGVVTALQFLPVLLLSAWAGVLADRLPRRELLIATQAAPGRPRARARRPGALGHGPAVARLRVRAAARRGRRRSTRRCDRPSSRSWCRRTSCPTPSGSTRASFNAARLIGPGLAGLLIAWVGLRLGVRASTASRFGATILALTAMRAAELHAMPRATGSRRGQLRDGLRYVRGRTDIVVIMVVMSVVSTFGLNFQLTSAMMARTVFGKGAGEYGVLGSVLAIGSLSGALLAARRERPRVRLVIGAAFAFGVAMASMALMPTYLSYAITASRSASPR